MKIQPGQQRQHTWGCHDRFMHHFIPDILLLGVLRHGNCLSIWFELVLDDFSVSVVLDTESVIQDTSDVIIPEEEEGRQKKCFYMKISPQSRFLLKSVKPQVERKNKVICRYIHCQQGAVTIQSLINFILFPIKSSQPPLVTHPS